MNSMRAFEGEVLIDHRDSPGIPAHLEVAMGLRPGDTRGKFECAVVTCKHCQRQIMMRPDRSRERGRCRGCNRYICDPCTAQYALDHECRDIERQFADVLERAYQQAAGTVHTGFAAPIASDSGSVETPTQTSVIVLP